MMRFVLYFPAKATGYYISFRESFSLFKGWALRTTLASVLAMLPFFIFTEVFRYGIHCLGAFLTEGLGQSVYIVFLQVFNAVDYVLLSSFVPMTVFLTVIQSRVYIEIIQKKRNLTLDEMRLHLDN